MEVWGDAAALAAHNRPTAAHSVSLSAGPGTISPMDAYMRGLQGVGAPVLHSASPTLLSSADPPSPPFSPSPPLGPSPPASPDPTLSSDATFGLTLAISSGLILLLLVLRTLFHHSRTLRRLVYQPRLFDDAASPHAAEEEEPASATAWQVAWAYLWPFPRWLRRSYSHYHAITHEQVFGLEGALFLKFTLFNFKVLCCALLFGLPVLLPSYIIGPSASLSSVFDESKTYTTSSALAVADNSTLLTEGALFAMSITHLPDQDARLVAPTMLCIVFSLAFIYLLQLEWTDFVSLHHHFLKRDGVHHRVLLVQVSSKPGCSDEDLETAELLDRLSPLVGSGEIVAGIKLRKLKAVQFLAATSRGGKTGGLTSEAAIDPLVAASLDAPREIVLPKGGERAAAAALFGCLAPSAAVRVAEVRVEEGEAKGLTSPEQKALHLTRQLRTAYVGEILPENRFLVLLSSRQAAQMLAASAELPRMLEREPCKIEVSPCPAPEDVYWPNLSPIGTSRSYYRWAAILATVLLFLFWTIPVAFVQSLATLDNLSLAVPFLQNLVNNLETAGIMNFIENNLSAWVLIGLRYITLYSGLFEFLARLGGAISHSDIQARAAGLIMLFQLLMVLLASLIASSLFDTLKYVIGHPAKLPVLLATALPSQSVFFLNYLTTATVLLVMLDLCRGLELVFLLFSWCCECCGCKRFCLEWVRGEPADYQIGRVYAAQVLTMQIAFAFLFIAPIMSTLCLCYVGFQGLGYAQLLREALRVPIVDSAGKVWEQAVVYEGYGVVVAQLLLIGVLLKKRAFVAVPFLLLLVAFTVWRLIGFRRDFGQKAWTLPLRTAMDLDANASTQKDQKSASQLASYTTDAYSPAKLVKEA